MPYNLLVVPIMPFVIYFKSKRLNTIVLHIEYFPIMLITSILYFISSLILAPFAYIFKVMSLFIVAISRARGFGKAKMSQFMQVVTFALSGMFILIIQSFIDTAFYVKNLYNMNIKERKVTLLRKDLSEMSIKILRTFLLLYINKKEKYVESRTFIR